MAGKEKRENRVSFFLSLSLSTPEEEKKTSGKKKKLSPLASASDRGSLLRSCGEKHASYLVPDASNQATHPAHSQSISEARSGGWK